MTKPDLLAIELVARRHAATKANLSSKEKAPLAGGAHKEGNEVHRDDEGHYVDQGHGETQPDLAPLRWRDHRVLTCAGIGDTRIDTGADYGTITLGEVFDQTEPTSCLKLSAPALIASTYHAFDGRKHEAQRLHGQYVAIPGDIDKGNTSLEKVQRLMCEFFGERVAHLIYSTASSTADSKRWRTLVPLEQPLAFADWTAVCMAFFGFMEANGCKMDWSLARAGQIAYLPNVPSSARNADGSPKFFVREARDGRGHTMGDGVAEQHVNKLLAQRKVESAALELARVEARAARDRRRAHRGTNKDVSVVEAYNAAHSIEDLLIDNLYEQSPTSDVDWRSPYQSSGSYATRVFDDHWISLSGSDAEAGLGADSKDGHRFGDAFDIYCHFTHGGNFSAAIKAAAAELGLQVPTHASGKTHAEIANTVDAATFAGYAPVEIADIVISELASAKGLKPSEVDELLKRLKEVTGLSIKALREDLARTKRRGPAEDAAEVSVEWPVPTARAFLASFFITPKGALTLRHWQDEFLAWNGSRYQSVSVADIRAKVYRLFERTGVPLPGRGVVDNTIDAVKALTNVASSTRIPSWLTKTPAVAVGDVVAISNGLLHLPTRTLLPHDPLYFSVDAADVAFDPQAPEPVHWLQFLADVFPGDQESIDSLQQWFGYLVTSDTSQQKALICVGPKRCGKGTIARVLRGLLGEHNFTGPTLGQIGKDFGLQGLINAKLAVISDARISGSADLQAISENLLRITGEDAVSVQRKGISNWEGKLLTRFVLMTNILPGIVDGGGAVASRFIVLRFTQSFFGREDHKLTEKLMGELPGILNWALDGLKALQDRGAFIQPASGLEAVEELVRKTTPILGFISDTLDFDAGAWVTKDDLYDVYRQWCMDEGAKHVLQKNNFMGEVYTNSDGHLTTFNPRVKGKDGSSKPLKAVKGARIKAEWLARIVRNENTEVLDEATDFDLA
ncbi:phage/plasmid primase, P4 family [Hydrogenophaga sp.]|uniref:DNA primase family protein n=1 Tax=Hydrogenophaga sp. TaxID=1904254 RepID=UPI002716F622|nr:DNA primase family protein [Hydrogenophaga sp.]MDO9507253.1 phage/plasmid primase, P4 family [Hydrogenophaga sp.]